MSAAAGSRFLDLRALASLARLRFTTRQRIEGSYSGRHRARQPGGAAEFSDFREYAEGEDLRRLDWKVLARTGRAYTRLYQDETNLNCSIVLDASNSMRFGTPSKLEYVQYFASALAHLISLQQDQVGLAPREPADGGRTHQRVHAAPLVWVTQRRSWRGSRRTPSSGSARWPACS